MADWQFSILVALLIWNVWRTRSFARHSTWLNNALLRRVFDQLNRIEALQRGVAITDVEQETEVWWRNEFSREADRPRLLPSLLPSRSACGPWCHEDWQTRGVPRREEIEAQARRSEFEASKRAAETSPQDAKRQYDLAMHYSTGYGVDRDEREAERLFKLAKDLGWRPLSDFTIGIS